MAVRVALVTCRNIPEIDPDEPLLLEAFAQQGVQAELCAWEDESVPWKDFAVALLRSTWNYYHQIDAFRRWVERVSVETKLVNPAPVVQWNLDKRYLGELRALGLPVIPTQWIEKGAVVTQAWDAVVRSMSVPVVVKPAVSAGSYGTIAVHSSQQRDEAIAHIEKQLARPGIDSMMVQPYFRSVEEWGERSLVWIGGEFRHAIRKSPRFGGQSEQVSSGTVAIEADERAVGTEILAAVRSGRVAGLGAWRGELAYARVDLARDSSGKPHLMELELVEPSLFFLQNRSALGNFVEAVLRGC